jgi:hypothetical protein
MQRIKNAPVVLVIDQFEELLSASPKAEDQEDQGEREKEEGKRREDGERCSRKCVWCV